MKTEKCWQIRHPDEQTACFKNAERMPCSPDNCFVEDAINSGGIVDLDSIKPLLHSECRMSSVSEDIYEFAQRMASLGEKNLLSMFE
ncbi:MAG: hypothetical protein HOA24_04310 [Candidatus Pacebacteria bacterium]|jgi:hypothetical protein|nr:hypothetical protein [Candidatus Paceibacterota bacterium]MBT6921392.1 hypothetical protein [Candidatus Paceibacterota bacterium]